MKLIYISHWRFPAEKTHAAFAMKTCEMFAKQGIEVELWAPWRQNRGFSDIDPFEYHGIRRNFVIRHLPSLDLTGTLPGSFFFFLMLMTFQLSFSVFYYIWQKTPLVFYFHDARDAVLPRWFGRSMFLEVHDFYKSSAKWINRRVFPRIKGFIVTNHFKMDVLKTEFGIPGERMLYQPNAVDIKMFQISISKKEARQRLNLPLDKNIILYTGHLFAWKGVDTLFDAHEFMGDNEVIYFVGGTDEDIEKFKFKNLKVSNVQIAGRKPHGEIPLWLRAADVLILPNTAKEDASKFETSPVKLFEYMASGTPIASSDLPSLRDILDERMAFFFRPDDPLSLAEAVYHILGHPAEAEIRAKKAREQAKNYTWERRTEAIVNFIKSKLT